MKKPSIANFFKSIFFGNGAMVALNRHKHFYDENHGGTVEVRKQDAAALNKNYYDLVTDFFEYGWGPSFHFGVRNRHESFQASLARHEMYLAHRMHLAPGMKVLDVGCGVGGPLRTIARFSGAHIVGVNNNAYQIERGRLHNREAGLEHMAEFIECDWINIPVESRTFDAAYSIEASCIAGDRVRLFREIHRVLKDDTCFAGYEWCMTPQYNPANPEHRRFKKGIEEGGGLPNLVLQEEILDAFKESGFEVLECRDLALECDPETPWYLPLKGEGLSLQTFRQSPLGGMVTEMLVTMLEQVRILPRGARKVSQMLRLCADSMVNAGDADIFTPMLFFYTRKIS